MAEEFSFGAEQLRGASLFGSEQQLGADEPRALAQQLCLIMEGAYVTRQVTGNKNTVDLARRIAKLVIESHCSCGADG